MDKELREKLFNQRLSTVMGLGDGDPQLRAIYKQAEDNLISAQSKGDVDNNGIYALERDLETKRAAWEASRTSAVIADPTSKETDTTRKNRAIAGIVKNILSKIKNFLNPEKPRQVFEPVPATENLGSPDPAAINYNPSATEDNGKSVFPQYGPLPVIDSHTPGAGLGAISSGGGPCGFQNLFSPNLPAYLFAGLTQGIKKAYTGFLQALGIGTQIISNFPNPTVFYVNPKNDSREKLNDISNQVRFNALPNLSNGDDLKTNSSADTSRQFAPKDIYGEGEYYSPVPSDPTPLYPTAPLIPNRGDEPQRIKIKPSPVVFQGNNQRGDYLSLQGNYLIKVNPYNRTYSAPNLQGYNFYRGISTTVVVDDRDGANIYFNGARTRDVLVEFEHGKAVEFDCNNLSSRNRVAIYKTLEPSYSVYPGWDWEPNWYAMTVNYPSTVVNYTAQNTIIFNNDPYTGVYKNKIFIDISAYQQNISFQWNKSYGCVYNHLFDKNTVNVASPLHDRKAVWYYKVTNNPSISGRIIFIPKTNKETTFYVTLTTVTENNILKNKYAVSRDEMVSWFIPNSSNKIIVSFTNGFSATDSNFENYTYNLILTNIPPSDALCFGGYSESTLNQINWFSSDVKIPHFEDKNEFSGKTNYEGLLGYRDIGVWKHTTSNFNSPSSFFAKDIAYSIKLPEYNQIHDGNVFYSSLTGGLLKFTVGSPPLSSGFTTPTDYGQSFIFSLINLRYVLSAFDTHGLTITSAPSSLLIAARYSNQYNVIGYDVNSVPLSWRIPYVHNVRPAIQSSTRWWDSEGIWGANGVSYDYDFEKDSNPDGYRKTHPKVKIFTKTATPSNSQGSYRMIRDFYVSTAIPSNIGRFFVSSDLVGGKIGINLNGGVEPEIVATVLPSNDRWGPSPVTMYFIK